MRIDCHIPITVRIVGVPDDDQLEALGRSLARAVAARLDEAERLLAERHGAGAGRAEQVRERYDPARDHDAGYSLASYGEEGKPTKVPAGKAPPKPPRLSSVRTRARTDPRAAEELVDRYWRMSDRELHRRSARGDETARAVLRQRTVPNDADLARALGSDYRPPHSATVVVRRGGVEVWRQELHSGNMTEVEAALGFPANMLATHTEARAVRRANLQRGDVMTIYGQYNPCESCQGAMQEAVNRTGATVEYLWMGGRQIFRPQSARPAGGSRTGVPPAETPSRGRRSTTEPTRPDAPAGTPRRDATAGAPAREATAGPPRAETTRPSETARPGETAAAAEPAAPARTTPTGPPPSGPPAGLRPSATSRLRPAQRAAGGAALAIVAINDFLATINMARNQARSNIDSGKAECAFWEWAGARPVCRVWDIWSKAPLPPGSEPSVSTFGSSSYPYVADIDIGALRQNLPARIRTYQDFLAFLAAARDLGTIQEQPRLPDFPSAADRLAATGTRYLVMVDKPDRAGRRIYDITDIVVPLRDAALARLDAETRAKVAALTASQRRAIYRLRHGPDTRIYRAATKGMHQQRIMSAQHFFGPDPWVRLVGPEKDVGGWFSTDIRVLVTPANTDAERAAEFATYRIFQSIEDTFEEVVEAGRPILDRQPKEGRLEGFVAGPMPGSTRFGVTRYIRNPEPDYDQTFASGQLTEFWVERDDLAAVSAVEIERYGHR